MDQAPAAPHRILELANGIYAPLAMRAAMQLDLFTPLADGPLNAAELAETLDVAPDRLELLLYALVAAGLLVVSDGRFANTPETQRFLVRGRAEYIGGLHKLYTELWGAALETAESIRQGRPQAEHDFLEMSEAELTEFLTGTHPGAVDAGRQLAARLDLGRFNNILDVAGGSGGLAIGICLACPDVRATVVDLPRVAPVARNFIAEARLSDRIDVAAADLVLGPPGGRYDAVVLRNFMQVLSADHAARALANIGKAVEPGGVVHIIGWVVDDDLVSPVAAALHNLVFINLYREGRAHSEACHRQWLEAAGFGDIERSSTAGGPSLVTARKR